MFCQKIHYLETKNEKKNQIRTRFREKRNLKIASTAPIEDFSEEVTELTKCKEQAIAISTGTMLVIFLALRQHY